jgi:hypothetical protein
MLGTALNMMLLSVPNLWGAAAIPEGTPSVGSWARGTTASCSAQGFLSQLGFVVPSYYAVLSFHSFAAVRNNFQLEKYKWIEPWIHVGVHIYPIASAIYLLTIDAFNFSGIQCWIASVPLGCGENSDEVCTRGPQDIGRVQWLFGATPIMLLLIVPTFMMIALYIEVRRRQATIMVEPKTAAKQAALYLLALYWSYMFSFIEVFLVFALDCHVFASVLLSSCVESLLGFWILLVYIRFRETRTEAMDESERKPTTRQEEGLEESKRFSIFDGTNARSKWAEFVYEGDGDDEEDDDLEAKKWADCVQT